MRVRLKGINSRKKRLAGGTLVTYYYAWKGGPRLEGAPGSPEFVASYERAVREKVQPAPGTLHTIIRAYQASADFSGLADRTRRDYGEQIKKIEAKFGTFPLAALTDRRSRAIFLEWRDGEATRSRRQADYAFTVLARIVSWAFHRGLVLANPLERSGRVYRGTRVDCIWTPTDVAAVRRVAGPAMRLAFELALNTGLRQGDILLLPWSAYNGRDIRLATGKTGAKVRIEVAGPLKAILDTTPRRSPIILTNRSGVPYSQKGFQSSWKKVQKRAGVAGLTFHDLRGTAVTRLMQARKSVGEIATITGHSLRDIHEILDRHYLSRDALLGDEIPDRSPDRLSAAAGEPEKSVENQWLGDLDSNQGYRSQSPGFYR